MARARQIYERWRASSRAGADALPPEAVMARIVRTDIAATHIANPANCYRHDIKGWRF